MIPEQRAERQQSRCQIINHSIHENMKVLTLSTSLTLVLSISTAVAQEFTIPDREHLQSMNHAEYDTYREQMRDRMDRLSPTERELMHHPCANNREQMEKRGANNSYGQGYVSRNRKNTVRSKSGINTGSQQSGVYGMGGVVSH